MTLHSGGLNTYAIVLEKMRSDPCGPFIPAGMLAMIDCYVNIVRAA